jgi:mono/diheme cytochrome c family protein
MIRSLLKFVWHLAALVGVLAIAIMGWLWTQGIGTRTPPGSIETSVSRLARQTMIPSEARLRANPHPTSADTVRAGMEHWADHCASCHANNGSGDTEIGRGLYPPAPDMRQSATQNMTDGELFYIIEHGVKLTGMPAWGTGTPEGELQSWHLVQFIRRLPTISDAELAEMEEMNPRGPAEWREREEERRFLSGEMPLPKTGPSTHEHKPPPR